jgi:hypothetical protein
LHLNISLLNCVDDFLEDKGGWGAREECLGGGPGVCTDRGDGVRGGEEDELELEADEKLDVCSVACIAAAWRISVSQCVCNLERSLDDALQCTAGAEVDFESGYTICAGNGDFFLVPAHDTGMAWCIRTETERRKVWEVEVLAGADKAIRHLKEDDAECSTDHRDARTGSIEDARKMRNRYDAEAGD